ncbi:MAG TPA: BON domain-containing protein [Chthonomonadaceae bacterium]|nr:BON domain-containing protein [Chthonomonadaceae bacterium]
MRTWRLAGAALALTLLLLPGCSGGKPGETGIPAASGGGEGAGATGNASQDDQITRAVQEKLNADAALKAAGIQAKAVGAQVELTGTVKTLADKEKAEAAAREAIKPFSHLNAGVVDNIQIEEPGDGTGTAGAPASPDSSGKK